MWNPFSRAVRPLPLLLSLGLLPLLPAAPALSQVERLNQIETVTLVDGKATRVTIEPIPASEPDFTPDPKPEAVPPPPPEKIHPVLKERMERGRLGEKDLVIISFHDTLEIPRFPDPIPGEPWTSPANQAARARTAEIIAGLKARRAEEHRRRAAEFRPKFGVNLVESFWLTNAMLVQMPLARIKGLAQRTEVLYLEPQHAGEQPPIGDGNALNDVIDGREVISSDSYFNLGLTSGTIALIDTGVRSTHVQLSNPNRIRYKRDCRVGTETTCTGSFPDEETCLDHGTQSAAILSANSNQGNDYRGVTAILLDSYKVYNCTGLDVAAGVRAIQTATAAGHRVIVAQMQSGSEYTGALSTAADRAFDTGAVVIAANGNEGPNPYTVNAPANAHKVIGVGAVDVASRAIYPGQSRGPTTDERIKPDIQAPTNTETASRVSDTALDTFGATSGSTPYAAGAAALFRNWLIQQGNSAAPGQVYAYMILSGQNLALPDNDNGAGLISMPVGGTTARGVVSVTNGQTIDIPISIGGTYSRLDVALWWPESATQPHNDIDFFLTDQTGADRGGSTLIESVFERARVTGSITGTWTLRINGYQVPAGPQTVYWATHAR